MVASCRFNFREDLTLRLRPVDIGLFLLFAPSYLIGIGIFCVGGIPGSPIGLIWFFATWIVHAFVLNQVDARGMRRLDQEVSRKANEAQRSIIQEDGGRQGGNGALAPRTSGSIATSTKHIAPRINIVVPDYAFHQPALKRFKSRSDGIDTQIFLLQFLLPLFSHCIFSAQNSDYKTVLVEDSSGEERLYLYSQQGFVGGARFPVFIRCSSDVDAYQFTLFASIAYVTGGNKFMPWDTKEYNVAQPLEDAMCEGIFTKVGQAYDAVKHFFDQNDVSEVLEMAKVYVDRPNEYLQKAGLAIHQPANSPNGVDDDGNIFTATEGKGTQDSARRWESGIKEI